MSRPLRPASRPARLFVALGLCVLIAGCSSDKQASTGATAAPRGTPAAGAAAPRPTVDANAVPFSPVVAATDLSVGTNRFSLGIIDNKTRQPVPDAQVKFRFFTLVGDQGTPRFEVDARFIAPARDAGTQRIIQHRHADGSDHPHANVEADVGVYIARVQFDQAGRWGVQTTFQTPDGRTGSLNSAFEVAAQSVTPAVGAPAPRTRNATVRDAKQPDLSDISSAVEPNPALYQTTVADALAAGKPVLVGFITPGYCDTQFCGPTYELVNMLLPKYGDKAALIHIEVYKDPLNKIPVDAVTEWKLTSEPYIFVLDKNGVVTAKIQGPVGLAELDEALAKVTS